ncbi:MAG: acyl-CoA reductase [Porticoccaceae bacterium]|nr:acyl-CoA reductase [Porticoccaceae bacterium]
MTELLQVPLILRGQVIEDYALEFGGRHGGVRFRTADVSAYTGQLTLDAPSQLADLYALSFADIVDYLESLGKRLVLDDNPHLQAAFTLACATSGLSESILRDRYQLLPNMFARQEIIDSAQIGCGIDFLEGWVEQTAHNRPGLVARVRAFGARAVHVVAGNLPDVSALTVLRNAITRSDCLIKTPSNDPLTAVALARTMIDMAPDHPLTRHVSVAYWKGGDAQVEDAIYDPRGVEKIVAWGGFNSIRHITKYLQPGIDLITLDPKLSGTIIGREAFDSDETLRHVARRLALDIGGWNQEGCVNARVIHVQSGTDAEGIACCERLARLTFEAMQQLPEHLSTPHKDFDPALRDELDTLRMIDEGYTLVGGEADEGAMIVSHDGLPVDFSRILACRVGNLVPIDDIDTAVMSVNAYTQTIGIYPDSLKEAIRDRLAFQGAQRLVSLGGAITLNGGTQRQDGIEPLRRMCKWITDESGDGHQIEQLALRE